MRLGITLEDQKGLQSNVVEHFRRCKSFFLLDIENSKIRQSRIVANTALYSRGGCVVADELLKYKVTHVISGEMGADAKAKFTQADVKILDYSGKAKDVIDDFLKNKIGGLGACKESSVCR